jgi:hypothetical protein
MPIRGESLNSYIRCENHPYNWVQFPRAASHSSRQLDLLSFAWTDYLGSGETEHVGMKTRRRMRLPLRLSEIVFFFQIFELRFGLALCGGRMETVFLEHLVKVGTIASGKLCCA